MLFLSLPAQANDTIRDWLTSGTFSRRSSPPIYWQSHMFCRDTERRSLVLRPSCECSDCADYPTCAVVLVSSPAAESSEEWILWCRVTLPDLPSNSQRGGFFSSSAFLSVCLDFLWDGVSFEPAASKPKPGPTQTRFNKQGFCYTCQSDGILPLW